jgi:hypothetical protein
MNLISSKDAFVDLTTIRVTGKESFLTAQPTPESTHTHVIDSAFSKDEFVELANKSIGGHSICEPIIVKMVLPNTQLAAPPSHFSFQTNTSFLHEKLKWLASLNRPYCFEVFSDNVDSITGINWASVCSWCFHNNLTLHLTVPIQIESLCLDLTSSYSTTACTLSVPFRQGLRQRC